MTRRLIPTARAGIRKPDVITHVHGKSVSDVRDFRRQLRTHDLGKGVRLTVRGGEAQRFVFVQVGE